MTLTDALGQPLAVGDRIAYRGTSQLQIGVIKAIDAYEGWHSFKDPEGKWQREAVTKHSLRVIVPIKRWNWKAEGDARRFDSQHTTVYWTLDDTINLTALNAPQDAR